MLQPFDHLCYEYSILFDFLIIHQKHLFTMTDIIFFYRAVNSNNFGQFYNFGICIFPDNGNLLLFYFSKIKRKRIKLIQRLLLFTYKENNQVHWFTKRIHLYSKSNNINIYEHMHDTTGHFIFTCVQVLYKTFRRMSSTYKKHKTLKMQALVV